MEYKFKGTQGEWGTYNMFNEPLQNTNEEGHEWEHLDRYITKMPENKIIASVRYCTSDNGGWPNVKDLAEFNANAALISAAPDLLEACILALSDFSPTDYKYQVIEQAIHKSLNIK